MITVEDRYFRFNRTLLLIVGLWPYQKSKLAQFQFTCLFSILTSSIIFQLATFVTSKCTANFVIKILSVAIFHMGLAIKYNSFSLNANTIKYSMEQLQCIYDNVKDDAEIAIIERYGNNARYYTIVLTIFVGVSMPAVMIVPFWRNIFHIILSVNQSQSHRLHITTEYFVDQERYFYLLLLHTTVAFCIGVVALLATGTMLIAYLQHACGMLRIANYRIENAMEIHTLHIQGIILPSENLVYKRMIGAIDIHRKAMMFSKYLINKFEVSFMFLIAFGVIALSLNIFRIFQAVTFGYNIEEFLMLIVVTTICVLYMFLSNFIGQEIIDHNNRIFAAAYNVCWYRASLQVQKLILFLLQRRNKVFGLYIGGLFLASLQSFATLTNTSVSYFTVMCSMQ
ncbi:odorant receptor 63a-like [Linepithema humile]|uniref:odorant receptor 63a-like n=1 Tax=Linepithema humile TaxID=83485 RepID=UPI00351F6E51